MDWTFLATPVGILGLVAFALAMRDGGWRGLADAIRAWRSRNGNGKHEQPKPADKPGEQTAEGRRDLAALSLAVPPELQPMTRRDGETLRAELEEEIEKGRHTMANIAQAAVSKADLATAKVDVVDRRQDKHSRILMEVQTGLAEHRGETREAIRSVREKQDEACERLDRVEQQQSESGALLKAVAAKLGVAG